MSQPLLASSSEGKQAQEKLASVQSVQVIGVKRNTSAKAATADCGVTLGADLLPSTASTPFAADSWRMGGLAQLQQLCGRVFNGNHS